MYGIELIAQHLVPFMLVTLRLSGLFAFTPILSNQGIPRRFRVLLSVMIAIAIYPMLPSRVQVAPDVDIWGVLPLAAGEFLLGLIMGMIAAIPVLLLDLAGFFMGHQMGMSLSRVFNPDSNSDTDTLGQIVMLLGIAVFVSMGGIELLFSSLLDTFGRVPAGGISLAQTPLNLMLATLDSGIQLAIRVAAPVTGIIFLLMIALGLISKTLPQLNVMSIGFTIKILAGLAMLMFAVGSIQQVTGDQIEQTLREVSTWAASLGAKTASHR